MGFTGREPPVLLHEAGGRDRGGARGRDRRDALPARHLEPCTTNWSWSPAIGVGGANIRAADAMKHVWGYAVGLDMTRRDLQGEMKKQGGPWRSARPSTSRPRSARSCRRRRPRARRPPRSSWTVNGAVKQSSTTAKLIWNVAETIEHLSAAWRLEPGDLIYTAAPEGVGAVKPGDLMEGRIDGVGTLKVRVALTGPRARARAARRPRGGRRAGAQPPASGASSALSCFAPRGRARRHPARRRGRRRLAGRLRRGQRTAPDRDLALRERESRCRLAEPAQDRAVHVGAQRERAVLGVVDPEADLEVDARVGERDQETPSAPAPSARAAARRPPRRSPPSRARRRSRRRRRPAPRRAWSCS